MKVHFLDEIPAEDCSLNKHMALKSVHMEGKLDGLMLEMNVLQRYQNETKAPLEMVYTFPLPWGVTLLGMRADIGERQLQAQVVAREEAHERYEEAIDEGDMPVMLEASDEGLYTANLGNISPGEKVVITVQFGQLLHFEEDRVRLCIPTAIAPRYGDIRHVPRLAAHEAPESSLTVSYPLTLRLDISGSPAQAAISSPSHHIAIEKTESGLTVLLEKGAFMDRDFVLNMDGIKASSFAVSAADGENTMLLASFCPRFNEETRNPLALKILVDCSSSMQGDSIFSAREALHNLLSMLDSDDAVSLSRFGSNVMHHGSKMHFCSPNKIRELSDAVSALAADMGGTEMKGALISAFRDIAVPENLEGTPGVLLITDAATWDVDSIIQACIASGHRIFAIGVGNAPAESLLREMTEKTGGACELVTPNEDMSGAVMRMISRLRLANAGHLQVKWAAEPLWQSPLPSFIYNGETVHVFARQSGKDARAPALIWHADGKEYTLSIETVARLENSSLERLGAAKEMAGTEMPEDRIRIALEYQLVSENTSLFLVNVRDEKDKSEGLPGLHHVQQMLAAGWAGYGSTVYSHAAPIGSSSDLNGMMFRRGGALRTGPDVAFDAAMYEIPAFLRRAPQEEYIASEAEPEHGYWLLGQMLADFNTVSISESSEMESIFSYDEQETDLLESMMEEPELFDVLHIWAVTLDWLIRRFRQHFRLNRHAHRHLRAFIKSIPKTEKEEIRRRVEQHLSDLSWEDLEISEAEL